jgi:hypothetical protein
MGDGWIAGASIVVVVIVIFVVARTAKTVAVARGRFAQTRRSQVCGVQWDGAC